MPNGTGFATVTIANSPIGFSYVSTGATLPLAIGFVPTAVKFWSGSTVSWAWVRGMGFGEAFSASSPTAAIATAGVLDVLDGSGAASTNVGTTSQVIGILLGTDTQVNSGALLAYRGLCYR